MNGYALGLIEVYGLSAAIEAADACVKSANVKLMGVQDATGALMTVKIIGDVGAVKAAISAGKARAAMVGTVIAVHVIARPADGLGILDENRQVWTVNDSPVASEPPEPDLEPEPTEFTVLEQESLETLPEPMPELIATEEWATHNNNSPTCNICQDLACPRQKGQPAKLCIHHARVREQKV